MTKIMAVILNYNTMEDSEKCALLLKKQKKADLIITIVDNNSTDGKQEILKTFCEDNHIVFVENKKNQGFSAGNNIGLKKAAEYGCEYALIINPDVEIRDEYYIYHAISKMKSDKNIAVLGTDVLNIYHQHQNPMRETRFLEEVFWPYVLVRNKLSKKLPFTKNYKKSGYCEKVSGCCFFIEMKFIQEINYLDENVFMYSEEPILAAFVKMQKKKEFYLHSETAFHMHRKAEKGNVSKRMEMLYNSRRYYLQKYSGYGKMRLAILNVTLSWQERFLTKRNKSL